MAERLPTLRRWAAVVCCLAGCAAGLVGSDATRRTLVTEVDPTPGAAIRAERLEGAPVRVLQLNLCNSGIARCYTGRSVAQASAVIRAEAPDVVTLNEICGDDVPALERALADVAPGGAVVSAFQAAGDRRTGAAFRCRNGRPYGIGLVVRRPPVRGGTASGGLYPVQDTRDPEERAWMCLDAGGAPPPGAAAPGIPAVAVCTTHLADTSRAVARAQCAHLLGTIVPAMRARDGSAPVVLGADLNLGTGTSADLRSCLPVGDPIADDGGVQRVVATPDLAVTTRRTIGMRGATDHPGLLVTLTLR